MRVRSVVTLCVLFLVAGVWAQERPIADISKTGSSTAAADVCGQIDGATVCVPVSIFAATFASWKPGDISPLAAEQADHADTYARWRNAEHQLAQVRAELSKLSAPKESEGIDTIRANWLKSVQAAAPPGMVFDEKTGKYVPKPAEAPAAGDKPKTGGGGGL